MKVLGIDIGGTGVKGAPVESRSGELLAPRFRVATPQPATPQALAQTVALVTAHFNWKGQVGCGVPGVVRHGVLYTAAHLDPSCIGADIRAAFEQESGCTFTVINDGDAAGLAEMRLGAGKGRKGVVFLCTLGTGIGTALFVDGKLVPNTELGHVEVRGKDAELRAAESARIRKGLSWKKWAGRVDEYLSRMQAYLWPELIIVGGGVSQKHERFLPLLTVDAEVVPAQMRNEAGIVGAALAAAEASRR
jgi:polyphosphate glucokinase